MSLAERPTTSCRYTAPIDIRPIIFPRLALSFLTQLNSILLSLPSPLSPHFSHYIEYHCFFKTLPIFIRLFDIFISFLNLLDKIVVFLLYPFVSTFSFPLLNLGDQNVLQFSEFYSTDETFLCSCKLVRWKEFGGNSSRLENRL